MKDYYQMTIYQLINECERKDSTIYHLRAGIQDVAVLIDNSDGVAGLYLNGDVAKWSDLRTGGSHEEWLSSFDEALDY